jgi:formylglycine-generating enzyme required for sulfatase activity
MAVVAAMVLLAAGPARADTHASWPTDWNNWNDPTLWVSVGNGGNPGELSGAGAGGSGPDRVCGAVDYPYRIGRFEVTAGQYIQFLNAVAATDAYGLYDTRMSTHFLGCGITCSGSPGAYTYDVVPERETRPVNYIDWGDAARFCNWLTNGQPTGLQGPATTEDGSYYLNGITSNDGLLNVVRKSVSQGGRYYIPTEDEWYKAAYHKNDGITGNYWDQATGADSVPSNALVDPDPGNNANSWNGSSYTIGSPYYRTEVGEFENSESPYGTFDQAGNVAEWTESIIDGSKGLRHCLRGGSYMSLFQAKYPSAAVRGYGYPSSNEVPSNWGFRVVEIPEPATVGLVALGGVLAAYRRLRRA